jgi:hypothetical protein
MLLRWSLTSLREKLIKIGEGRQPRPLRHAPNGRDRGSAADVPKDPDAHRPVAGTARSSMKGFGVERREPAMAEVRLDESK